MGQVQSEVSNSTEDQSNQQSSAGNNPHSSSMEALIAEATAFGESETESLDAKAEKALECPCIAGLRKGPCGTQFSEAFVCFLKSTAEEKGSDCVHPFVALQSCIKANPGAFSKDVVDEEESQEEEENTQEYKIIPPTWSKESTQKL